MSAQATGLSSCSRQVKIPQMYTHAGASFQEWALRLLDRKGSIAHRSIGRFVMAINNGRMTIGEAKGAYGLTILGVLGEAAKLTVDERKLVVDTVIETVVGRVPVVVGTSHQDTP